MTDMPDEPSDADNLERKQAEFRQEQAERHDRLEEQWKRDHPGKKPPKPSP